MLVIGEKIFIDKWTTAMRVFAVVVVHNHTWQLIIVCNSKVQTVTYTKKEIQCH